MWLLGAYWVWRELPQYWGEGSRLPSPPTVHQSSQQVFIKLPPSPTSVLGLGDRALIEAFKVLSSGGPHIRGETEETVLDLMSGEVNGQVQNELCDLRQVSQPLWASSLKWGS